MNFPYNVSSLCYTSPTDMIRTEHVEPSKPRGSGRTAGVWFAIGKAGTAVQEERQRGGARNRSSARKADINITAQQQPNKKRLPQQLQHRTERQLPRNLVKIPADESSPVAPFGAATLSDLEAASTVRRGEGAAEGGECDPPRERERKRGQGSDNGGKRIPVWGRDDSRNFEISTSL